MDVLWDKLKPLIKEHLELVTELGELAEQMEKIKKETQ